MNFFIILITVSILRSRGNPKIDPMGGSGSFENPTAAKMLGRKDKKSK